MIWTTYKDVPSIESEIKEVWELCVSLSGVYRCHKSTQCHPCSACHTCPTHYLGLIITTH